MAEINGEEKRITVSGEQIEEAVGKVPTIEADVKSNKQSISALQTASAQHTADIAKNTADIALKANAEEVYTISQTVEAVTETVAEIVANADDDFDTLRELSDWLKNHSGSAAEMNSAIQANTKAIADNATAIEANTADIEQNKSDILSACVGMGLIEVKNLFNKDGEINSTYSGSVVSNTSADFNTVNGNIITFNRNSSTSHPTGQFIRNLKNKKIIVSFNCLSYGTGTTVAFRIFKRGSSAPLFSEYPKLGYSKYIIDIAEEEVLFGFATSGGRGAQIENLMIRYAEITDDTYAPFTGLDLQGQIYALTDRIKALEAVLAQTTATE